MKLRRFSLLLALVFCLTCLPVSAAEESAWLISKLRDAPAFTDTSGTVAAQSAALCAQVGLMDGVDSRHYMPSVGLNG